MRNRSQAVERTNPEIHEIWLTGNGTGLPLEVQREWFLVVRLVEDTTPMPTYLFAETTPGEPAETDTHTSEASHPGNSLPRPSNGVTAGTMQTGPAQRPMEGGL